MSRRMFTHHGRRMAYSVKGSGPPVLFVQGVGLHGDGWEPQTDVLCERFTCLSFDNRGTGDSGWDGMSMTVSQLTDDAVAVLDDIGWSDCHVVGHSLGGLIAMQLALLNAGRVRSLSLLCTFASGRAAAPMTPKMLWLSVRCRLGTAAMRRRAFLKLLLSPKGFKKAEPEKAAARLKPLFGHDIAEQPPVVKAQLKALRGCDLTAKLGRLADIPTLVASAMHDPIAPPKAGRALAKAIPGSRYVEWGDASHGAPIEHTARVNAAIKEHITAAEAKAAV